MQTLKNTLHLITLRLASLSLTIVVLVLMTLTAAGNLLLQNSACSEMDLQNVPGLLLWLTQCLVLLGLNHSPWMRFLLIVFCLNLRACMLSRMLYAGGMRILHSRH